MNNAKREILKGCINIIGTVNILEKSDFIAAERDIAEKVARADPARAARIRKNILHMEDAINDLLIAIEPG